MCPAAPRICPRRGAVSHSRAVEHRPGGSGSCQGSEPRLQLARSHSARGRGPTPAELSCLRAPQRNRHTQPSPFFLTPEELG